MDENINQAAGILNKGGIIIFPTDTVWGVGCRIDNKEAITRLYQIRKRPLSQACPVLVGSLNQALEFYKNLPDRVAELIKMYWPGGLTVVYFVKDNKVPPQAVGGKNAIGIRMPNSKPLLELINKVGVPILGPSANFHGQPSPTNINELNKDFIKLADFVVEGESGGQKSSTVIDCTISPWNIIRPGAIKIDEKLFPIKSI